MAGTYVGLVRGSFLHNSRAIATDHEEPCPWFAAGGTPCWARLVLLARTCTVRSLEGAYLHPAQETGATGQPLHTRDSTCSSRARCSQSRASPECGEGADGTLRRKSPLKSVYIDMVSRMMLRDDRQEFNSGRRSWGISAEPAEDPKQQRERPVSV